MHELLDSDALGRVNLPLQVIVLDVELAQVTCFARLILRHRRFLASATEDLVPGRHIVQGLFVLWQAIRYAAVYGDHGRDVEATINVIDELLFLKNRAVHKLDFSNISLPSEAIHKLI